MDNIPNLSEYKYEREMSQRIATLEKVIEQLKEKNKKLENEAKAWKIINHGADWEYIRDLCDEGMCEALIKTGECDKEDFDDGFDYLAKP